MQQKRPGLGGVSALSRYTFLKEVILDISPNFFPVPCMCMHLFTHPALTDEGHSPLGQLGLSHL
jgi:hypothetical protein